MLHRLPHLQCLVTLLAALGLGLASPRPLRAQFPPARETKTTTLYPPVVLTTLVYAEPRPLRVWAVKIDLTSPDIAFQVTPRGKFKEPKDKVEAVAATTLDFAKEFGVQVAINGTCFWPVPRQAGQAVDIVGLSINQGDRYSEPEEKNGALVFDAGHRATILSAPIKPEQLQGVAHAVGGHFGNGVILAGGKNLYAHEKEPGANAPVHPRTAAGLSADRQTLWWIIVDGRQRQTSEGVNLYELAELGRSLGCHDVLNLDGGGSTTLVVQDQPGGGHRVVNTPVGLGRPGSLRWNGNNLGLYVFTEGRSVTAAQLKAVMPTLTPERLGEYLGPLNRAMAGHDITTPRRRAAFLAQLAHESGELRYREEIASGEAYEGRKDLGNTQPGDGKRYKGRGPIQLTGRDNYRRAGAALGLDLENRPELAALPDNGCQVAGWFWKTRQLNDLADQGDFQQITRRVNGGLRGLPQREAYYRKALEVFQGGK